MARSLIRRALAPLALGLAAACGDGSPDCVATVHPPITVQFALFAPGAPEPFANARLRQEQLEYQQAGCPGPQSSTYLRFEPLGSYFVTFDYRLDYRSDRTTWSFTGKAGFTGTLVPTNDLLVSNDPDPIDTGSGTITFLSFTPL